MVVCGVPLWRCVACVLGVLPRLPQERLVLVMPREAGEGGGEGKLPRIQWPPSVVEVFFVVFVAGLAITLGECFGDAGG